MYIAWGCLWGVGIGVLLIYVLASWAMSTRYENLLWCAGCGSGGSSSHRPSEEAGSGPCGSAARVPLSVDRLRLSGVSWVTHVKMRAQLVSRSDDAGLAETSVRTYVDRSKIFVRRLSPTIVQF
jgi:hypothetical protein